jgi:membrane protease YdiL (CAAX protease family)
LTAPDETPEGRTSPVPLAVFFYASLFVASLVWVAVRVRWEPLLAVAAGTWGILPSATAGVLIAAVVVGLSVFLERRSSMVRVLGEEIRTMLGPLTEGQVIVISVLSALAEEAFFRWAMQDAAGIWISALLFAALHTGRGVRFFLWTLFSLLLGLAFGFMVASGSGLLAVTLAHALINYCNLGRLCGPGAPAPTMDG